MSLFSFQMSSLMSDCRPCPPTCCTDFVSYFSFYFSILLVAHCLESRNIFVLLAFGKGKEEVTEAKVVSYCTV